MARKQAEQTRQVRLGVAVVGGLLLLVFLAAAINELFIAPNRPVAVINEENISLRDWQDRVKFERAQRIILLENQLEAFQGNVGVVQQFAGQAINDLLQSELLGQNALNQMIDETVIRQAAENANITKTADEVLALLAVFARQWQRYREAVDKVGARLESTRQAYEDLTGTRTRQLERPLAKIDELRSARGLPEAGPEADETN